MPAIAIRKNNPSPTGAPSPPPGGAFPAEPWFEVGGGGGCEKLTCCIVITKASSRKVLNIIKFFFIENDGFILQKIWQEGKDMEYFRLSGFLLIFFIGMTQALQAGDLP